MLPDQPRSPFSKTCLLTWSVISDGLTLSAKCPYHPAKGPISSGAITAPLKDPTRADWSRSCTLSQVKTGNSGNLGLNWISVYIWRFKLYYVNLGFLWSNWTKEMEEAFYREKNEAGMQKRANTRWFSFPSIRSLNKSKM